MINANDSGRILTFSDYRDPAERLAEEVGLPLSQIEVHKFPDDESLVRLPATLPDRVILVRSLDHPNSKLIEVLLAAEAARAMGVSSLTLVAPYLCYMRQDTAFHPGEAISQRIIGRFLARLFDRIITVDPHLHRTSSLAEVVPDTSTCVLSAAVPMAHFLRSSREDPLLVGPDVESEQWVRAIAREGPFEYVVASKERSGDAQVCIALPEGKYAGRDVVLVDDIASTGRSLVATATKLRSHAPRSISALVTHGLFAGDALNQLTEAGLKDVWSTDSVANPTVRITLGKIIGEAL